MSGGTVDWVSKAPFGCGRLGQFGWIDPNSGRECRWYRCALHKALGMCGAGQFQGGLPFDPQLQGFAIMDGLGRHIAEAAVMMFVVVPRKKRLRPDAGVR